MTMMNVRCDACGRLVGRPRPDPASRGGVRLTYHPGAPSLRDDSGLVCSDCWVAIESWLGARRRAGRCTICNHEVSRRGSLHIRPIDEKRAWQLCPPHAADLLNALVTVQPKFDRASFRLPLDEDLPGPGP